MHTLLVLATMVAFSAVSSPASACTKDTDCRGDRICVDGACVEPGAAPAQPAPARAQQVPEPRTGWAMAAGIMGLVGAGLTGILIAASVATLDFDYDDREPLPSAPLGGTGGLIAVLLSPVVFTGGVTATAGTDAKGPIALRILGWITYGGMWIAGLYVGVVRGAIDKKIPHPLHIAAMGGAGFLSLIFFSADSLVSRSRAIEAYEEQTGLARADPRPPTRLLPTMTAARAADGSVVPGVGLLLMF